MKATAVTIDTFVTGPLEVNTYVLRSAGQCAVVDPGSMTADRFTQFLADEGIDVSQIWLTHGHGDHIAGVGLLKEMFPKATVYCPAADVDLLTDPARNLSTWFEVSITTPPPDVQVQPGDTVTLGETTWQVLDTSGHTPGGVSFYCQADRVVLGGDALFAGGIGKTEIPGGDMGRLIANIFEQLLALPDDTTVLPGHGPATAIGAERRTNFFLRRPPT